MLQGSQDPGQQWSGDSKPTQHESALLWMWAATILPEAITTSRDKRKEQGIRIATPPESPPCSVMRAAV